jgi:hypothetical protein
MNETERRTGPQGGAYVGGKWFSADELRAAGRRVTDGFGRSHMGVCPACGGSRLGATDGPGSLQFAEGSECFHCGHVAVADIRRNVEMAERPDLELRSSLDLRVEDASRRILDAEEGNGEAIGRLDDEEP